MIHLITGGSASGKSAYAEAQAVAAGEIRYYIATMRPDGAEGGMRVAKHRRLREGKGFTTIECYTELAGVSLEKGEGSPAGASDGQRPGEGSPAGADGAGRVILLECMSNLVANELFDVGGSDEEICRRILAGIRHLQNQAKHLIIVTNEVFSDGLDYDPETVRYIRLLGRINRLLAERAGQVTEVVYGIPVERKPCPREKGKGPEQPRGAAVWPRSLAIAFSMYSRFPVPQVEWSEHAMRYALCFFPLVGVAIGICMEAFWLLAVRLELGAIAVSGLGTALPLLFTGGIHMDGFLDTVDARSSCQSRERKLEILKDPHTGAFAIIGCGVYMLCYMAFFSELGQGAFPAVCGVYVLTRALSGWSVVSFPKAKKDGLVSTFARQAADRTVRISMAVWGILAAVYLLWTAGPAAGSAAVLAAAAVFWWYYHMAKKEFGGITGDLAGYFLQLCELVMIGVLAAAL